ncbi:PHD finger protein ALFIN-LIKE 2-like [Malania oleifera]|uniref:PHD finger protein ALFIN-LIKE 2-like n=1 Tax=Malania oleifera TaxID=397392 RepID=UPI0025AE1CDF|nr:PHD finger protein ALFIN-LIKE 2-like [Malania oleifera]
MESPSRRDVPGRELGMTKNELKRVEFENNQSALPESRSRVRLCEGKEENLCLYIQPNETWEVTLLVEEVPLPKPALRINDGQVKGNSRLADENYEEDENEHSETLCRNFGGNYNADEFWIDCNICEKWFHVKCVKITPAKVESIK